MLALIRYGNGIQEKPNTMNIQDELSKLHAQLALCERLLVNLTESRMCQAIEDYASELETKLSLLLSGIDALQANCANPPPSLMHCCTMVSAESTTS